MVYAANAIARLLLLQQHRQESKLFWANEIEDRHALADQHRQQKDKLPPLRKNGRAWAIVIQRHTSEIMEFHLSSDDRRWILQDRQDQELADLA